MIRRNLLRALVIAPSTVSIALVDLTIRQFWTLLVGFTLSLALCEMFVESGWLVPGYKKEEES